MRISPTFLDPLRIAIAPIITAKKLNVANVWSAVNHAAIRNKT